MEVLEEDILINKEIPVQYSVIEQKNEVIYSRTSFATQPKQINLCIEKDSAFYIALKNSYIIVKCKLVKANGSQIDASPKIGVVNNLAHSLFSSIRVFMNDILVTPNEAHPAYAQFIQYFLEPNDLKKAVGSLQMYYEDTLTSVDACDQSNPQATINANDGLKKRSSYFGSSKTVTLVAPLRVPPHTMETLLLPSMCHICRQPDVCTLTTLFFRCKIRILFRFGQLGFHNNDK